MYVIQCSNFLGKQEQANRARAQSVSVFQRNLVSRRRGVWRLLGFVGIIKPTERNQRLALNRVTTHYIQSAERWAKGRMGEDALARSLSALDDRYCLFRNYTPPPPFDCGGDIDAILIGPQGLTVFEVKSWAGAYRVIGENWEHWSSASRRWEPTAKNPTAQVKANSQRLEAFLASVQLANVPIKRVVAMTDPNMRIAELRPTGAYIFLPHQRNSSLDRLVHQPGARQLSWDLWARLYTALVSGNEASSVKAGRPQALKRH